MAVNNKDIFLFTVCSIDIHKKFSKNSKTDNIFKSYPCCQQSKKFYFYLWIVYEKDGGKKIINTR